MALHLSEASEQVASRAQELSQKWRHYFLSTEHYFAAAVQLDNFCRQWLASKGLDFPALEKEILELVPTGDDTPPWDGLPQSPRLRRVLGKPSQEAAEACRAMRVDPRHILAAVMSDGKGIPVRILAGRGVDARQARGELLGSSAPSGGLSGPDREERGVEGSEKDKKKKEKMLARYARDLVDAARNGKFDPVVGRNEEVRRVLTVLTRKTKSNPVLIGEAGVGKTAVALGLAQRIADGTVPDALKDRRLMELNLSAMLAGAKHRGEFEERLQGVIDEVAADDRIILFIDEIHQLVGAGDSRGGMDASNILKPALARGEFPVVGSTTTEEYRRYIEADPALERRFQPVLVSEPSEEDAFTILKGLRQRYELHHGVKFTDDALLAAVKLSVRFLPDRNLPDKAIDLIDESAARVKTRSGVFNTDGAKMVFEVTADIIAEVVSDWTGIPVNRMSHEESQRLLDMENLLQQRVVGQDHACTAVAQTIRVVRMGLVSPTRPGGVFFFLGPSGVGKTELAKALAEFLFGSEKEMVRLDMSEFHDKHSISRLIGSPPGYVGHDEEGQLTGAVRTRPYSVVLLDEVEKAHPEVFDLFLQVFDDGRLTDSKGRTVNFANTIIV
ncbi:MAG: ATP-dependent Clp protease ATP-binding subunit, partial [Candidatus Eremiobacterota bacterium]